MAIACVARREGLVASNRDSSPLLSFPIWSMFPHPPPTSSPSLPSKCALRACVLGAQLPILQVRSCSGEEICSHGVICCDRADA